MTEAAQDLQNQIGDPAEQARKMFEGKMTNGQKCMALLCILGVVGVFVTITVYLGIYGYNNPDPDSCWVVKGLDAP